MNAPTPNESRAGFRAALNDMLWLLVVPLVLIVFARVGRLLPDAAFVATVLLLALFLSSVLWLRAVVRRRIFLAGAIREQSAWYHRLRGGVPMALFALFAAVPLATILLVAVVRAPGPGLLIGMILNLPLLVLLRQFWYRRLAGHAVARFRALLALRLALWVNLGVLALAFAVGALFRSYPEFSDFTLIEAMLSEAGRQEAVSGMLQVLMQIAAAKDAAGWWLGQQVLPGLLQPGVQVVGWLILLATDLLVIWSYLLTCAAVLAVVHWRQWHPGRRAQ